MVSGSAGHHSGALSFGPYKWAFDRFSSSALKEINRWFLLHSLENRALRTLHDIQDQGGLSNDLKFYIFHSPFAFRVAGPGY